MKTAPIRLVVMALAACLSAMVAREPDQHGDAPALPARLQSYLATEIRLTGHERRQLAAGAPVVTLLDADESKEVAVFGAIWIAAPIPRYVALVNDIENLERGNGFRLTRRISDKPTLADFREWRLPEDDFEDLHRCRPGDCSVKLSGADIARVRRDIDWSASSARSDADALMRRIALEYVTGYLEGGDARLPVYRDRSHPTSVAAEFRDMVDHMRVLAADWPNLRRFLLGFPTASLPDATSFLYWQETEFGLKPTNRISQVVVRQGPDDTVVASKMLYATHYFWTALELRTLVPDPARGPGFWFVSVKRSRADGMSGLPGFFVRRRVRSEVQDGMLAGLRMTKRRLEAAR